MHNETDDKTRRSSKATGKRDRPESDHPPSRSPRSNISERHGYISQDGLQAFKRLRLEGSAASSSAPATQLIDQQRQSLEGEEVMVEFLLSRVLEHLEDRKTKKWEALLQWEKEGTSLSCFL